jgi:DNA-binding NtrC family response regulator
MALRILLVDDEAAILEVWSRILQKDGHRVTAVADERRVSDLVSARSFDLIICDMYLSNGTAFDVLDRVRGCRPDIPFVIASGFGTMDMVQRALPAGVLDVLAKPVGADDFRRLVRKVAVAGREGHTRNTLRPQEEADRLVGRSAPMIELYKTIARAAPLRTPVIIEGEPGTGKTLVAREFHARGPQAKGRFVTVECRGISPDALEVELTGAGTRRRGGALAEADGGTLLIENVDFLPPLIQDRVARMLDESRLGLPGTGRSAPRFRLITTTERGASTLVRDRALSTRFLERIMGTHVRLVPLRERKSDIGLLAERFLMDFAGADRKRLALGKSALKVLERHGWPGNVTELRRQVEAAAAACGTGTIEAEELRTLGEGSPYSSAALRSLEEVEREHILAVVQHVDGNRQRAAEILGIDRKTLQRKLRRFGS